MFYITSLSYSFYDLTRRVCTKVLTIGFTKFSSMRIRFTILGFIRDFRLSKTLRTRRTK